MSGTTVLWLRRNLRLRDNAALARAVAAGGPVIPLFIYDEEVAALGAASKLRLDLSLRSLAADLSRAGSRLILRSGTAGDVLAEVAAQVGAGAVVWQRSYDPTFRARDTAIKSGLTAKGIAATSVGGFVLFEPWTVETGSGGPYRVYSPFWRAVRGRDVAAPLAPPSHLSAPSNWPASDRLEDWQLRRPMHRGAEIVAARTQAGEAAALDKLDRFLGGAIDTYSADRDRPDLHATSGMSEHLTWGEVSPALLWSAGQAAMARGSAGAEHFLKELVWREFAWHLAYHSPEILSRPWRAEWQHFPWDQSEDREKVVLWRQARTGVPLVDAGLREMYVTGRMHNRVRMIVASYLTKTLLADWRIGQAWFADCLTDWDPASNAMGWQWVAGSGPDASPFFRIFNPLTQAEKFDPGGHYRRRWIAEGEAAPDPAGLSYFQAVPKAWSLDPTAPYAQPVVDHADGRARALAAYEAFKSR